MERNKWIGKTIALLRDLYPTETNARISGLTGMSVTAVKTMARRLGLSKAPAESNDKWMRHVLKHFRNRSFSEMAADLGVTKTTIHRIAVKLSLKRTKAENTCVNSRVRCEIIRRERRRVLFGLEPVTNIKVVTNRPRIQLRAKLKAKGYIVGKERNILYYPESFKRQTGMEARGIKLGLRFFPLAENDIIILSTAI